MGRAQKRAARRFWPPHQGDGARAAAFAVSVILLALVPLAFSTSLYRVFTLPKFALLVTGSSALLPLLALSMRGRDLKRKHVALVLIYLITIGISTAFGIAPVANLFGSLEREMGLITHLSFFICFLGLIVAIGESRARLNIMLWTMALTGLAVATYAFLQFFGRDPFLRPDLYSYQSAFGRVTRVIGTLGHADYLGNFLLYTTPISASLAILASGRLRLLATVASLLSVAAIVFSGTRGAWVGLGAGAIAFALLERAAARNLARGSKRAIIKWSAIVFTAGAVFVIATGMNPASENLLKRARVIASEGLSGSGRGLLWRDSLRLATANALTGCGPEGFRKAFLAYKSTELARLAPQINNESSHNAYLDAAISYGLPGAIACVAIISSAILLLIRARRAADWRMRVIATGLLSSLVAVSIHNFFIFDQIPTGLYFFAFAALAQAAYTVAAKQDVEDRQARAARSSAAGVRRIRAAAALAGCAAFAVALWYSIALVRADYAINRAFAYAEVGDLEQVIRHGQYAAESPEPAAGYDFLYARALALSIERKGPVASEGQANTGPASTIQARAIDIAVARAEASLAHTLAPESNYVLLAYLSLIKGDAASLGAFASEAVKWDASYPAARWLMAEAYLARGDRERAAREAEIALSLKPASRRAAKALARAAGEERVFELTSKKSVERALRLAEAGRVEQAERTLLRALRKSVIPCAQCRRALAEVYEIAGSCGKAVSEWQEFMRADASPASIELAQRRIEIVKRRMAEGACKSE